MITNTWYENVPVTYTQTLRYTVDVDTGWDDGPYVWFKGEEFQASLPRTAPNNINNSRVTRAGYPISVRVYTDYSTDWETKVPKAKPQGPGWTQEQGYVELVRDDGDYIHRIYDAQPIGGGKPPGVQEIEVYDPQARVWYAMDEVKPTSEWENTFELPRNRDWHNYRLIMTDEHVPDGPYDLEIYIRRAGWPQPEGLCDARVETVTIRGAAREDWYVHLIK